MKKKDVNIFDTEPKSIPFVELIPIKFEMELKSKTMLEILKELLENIKNKIYKA